MDPGFWKNSAEAEKVFKIFLFVKAMQEMSVELKLSSVI